MSETRGRRQRTSGAVAAPATGRWHGRKRVCIRTRAGSAEYNVHTDHAKGRWPKRPPLHWFAPEAWAIPLPPPHQRHHRPHRRDPGGDEEAGADAVGESVGSAAAED